MSAFAGQILGASGLWTTSYEEIAEFIDANELGLALEYIADSLCEDEQPVSVDERLDMCALATRMQMDGRVARALAFCPSPAK